MEVINGNNNFREKREKNQLKSVTDRCAQKGEVSERGQDQKKKNAEVGEEKRNKKRVRAAGDVEKA